MIDVDKLYKPREVANIFSVTPQTVAEWLREGVIQGVKIGRGHYWRIPGSAIVELARKKYGEDREE
jgi:excisionase family DNA binding protein